MSPDHLCKEGLAEREDIEISSNNIAIFTITFYGTHNNVHFYLFGFVTSIFYWIYQSGTDLYNTLLFIGIWFSILTTRNHNEYHYQTLP